MSDLGKKLEVKRRAVESWEYGVNDVSRHQINAMAKLFKVSPTEALMALQLPKGPLSTDTGHEVDAQHA